MAGRGRKHRHEEHENHERWLVSYADFITLLFAFFVVMYAISSVNEGKYRVLSNALDQAFNTAAVTGAMPIQRNDAASGRQAGDGAAEVNVIGEGSPSPIDLGGPGVHNVADVDGNDERPHATSNAKDIFQNSETIVEDLTQALLPLIDRDLIQIREADGAVEVEMKSNVLFSSGRADVVPAAVPVLREIGTLLSTFNNPITIEGYTDSQPIANSYYASNWELSAARAASVAHLLNKLDVDGNRLTAVGYGEFRPITDNATAAGRQRNRRVVMVIATRQKPRDDTLNKSATNDGTVIKPWEKVTLEGPGSLNTGAGATTRTTVNSKRTTKQP